MGQAPNLITQFRAESQAAGVLRALARPDQLGKNTPAGRLLGWGQAGVNLAGVAGQSALHLGNRFVAGVRQLALLLLLPQRGHGELKQGQVARLLAHISQDALDQTTLKGDALLLGRPFDGLAQLLSGHRSQLEIVILQGIGKGTMGQSLFQKIGSQGKDQNEGGAGLVLAVDR